MTSQLDALLVLVEHDHELAPALADLLGAQRRACERLGRVREPRGGGRVGEVEDCEGCVGCAGLRNRVRATLSVQRLVTGEASTATHDWVLVDPDRARKDARKDVEAG